MNTEPRLYDMSFWIRDDKSGNAPDSFFDRVKNTVTQLGGAVVRERRIEKRDLAYPIAKQLVAWWAEMQFTLEPQRLAEFKDLLKYEDAILRKYIMLVVQKKRRPERRPAFAERRLVSGRSAHEEKSKEPDVDLDAKLKQILET